MKFKFSNYIPVLILVTGSLVSCGGGGSSNDEDSPAFDLSFGVYGYTAQDLSSTGFAHMPIALDTNDNITFAQDTFGNGVQSYSIDGAFQLIVEEYNGDFSNEPITVAYNYSRNVDDPTIAEFNETETLENTEELVSEAIATAVANASGGGASSGISEVLEVPVDYDPDANFVDLPSNARSVIVTTLRSLGIVATIGNSIGLDGEVYVRSFSDIDLGTTGPGLIGGGTTFPQLNAMITAGTTPTISGTANRVEVWHQLVFDAQENDSHFGVSFLQGATFVNFFVESQSNFTITLNGVFD